MKFKTYPVQIWFLDNDLELSAQYLNNKLLNKSINGCFQALVCTYFYYFGIRNRTIYKYYFDKLRKHETMDKYFPLWPLKIQPKHQAYGTRQSKWCRKCNEHFQFVRNYMKVLCAEYEYRTGKMHGMQKFIEWMEFDARQLAIPNANIKKITLEWKVLNPKWRRKDIIQGYRLQYKALLQNDGIDMKDFTKRDIPEWLVSKENKWLD